MSQLLLKILNPADHSVVATVPVDAPVDVRRKYARARAAQPAWAATPLRARIAAIRAFREALVRDRDALAAILTAETGKPIAQARNELTGVLGRIEFFMEHA